MNKMTDENDLGKVIDIGIASTASVMGRSLRLQSMNSLPDEKMADFEQKWMTQIHGKPLPGRAKSGTWKMAVGALATVAVFVGIVLSVSVLNDSDPGRWIGISPPTQTSSVVGGREIQFVGYDCDCGHINPQSVSVGEAKPGDGEPTWDIINEENAEVLFSGDTAAVNNELKRLSSEHIDGKYIMQCTFITKNDTKVVLERSFVVGNYSGDAPA
jgi:hypothetical protein